MVGIAGFEPAFPEGSTVLQTGAINRIRMMPKLGIVKELAESKRLERLCPKALV